ncbi:MAG: hydroxyacid dehydrogenase [Ponticaulis sp.]|nr:hydroxyacid dehydrogenase [Ponticaulis sp.]|tara:strand:- start:10885 stop:12309 length:1425 start_codon:yes stop_codon:yes gene_type:complete
MSESSQTLPVEFVTSVKSALGPKGWSEDQDEIQPYLEDWRGNYKGFSSLLVKPASTEEVAAVLKLCDEYSVAITPQGGNTSLVNGGIPYGEVILSLKRLNRIRSTDPLNNSIVAEVGCVLTSIHDNALEHDRFFPLSLGSQGTATIGGLISTNAGGVAVLRYGMMRDLLLGLEVVTAEGEIWNGLRGLRKDNTGYDLKHLFAGAEGTLGIVTAASLKLFPVPKTATAWLTLETVEDAVELLSLIRSKVGDTVTSFELMRKPGVELACEEIDTCRDPLPSPSQWRVLVEISMSDEALAAQALESALEAAFERELITDGAIATSLSQAEDFWTIRESLPLVKRGFMNSVNHDVSVPVSRIAEFIDKSESLLKREIGEIEVFVFGHLGDGNLHYAVAEPAKTEKPIVRERAGEITNLVHGLIAEFDGSISAEHGIGLMQRDDLLNYKSPLEIDLMRSIKRALDPKNILNPGRIFPLD